MSTSDHPAIGQISAVAAGTYIRSGCVIRRIADRRRVGAGEKEKRGRASRSRNAYARKMTLAPGSPKSIRSFASANLEEPDILVTWV